MNYGVSAWEEMLTDGYLFDEGTFAADFWELPLSADEFKMSGFFVVPFCTLVDGGEPIATYNLELVKRIEYQQAEVKVYKKVNLDEPGYLVYSGDDCNPPTLFECE